MIIFSTSWPACTPCPADFSQRNESLTSFSFFSFFSCLSFFILFCFLDFLTSFSFFIFFRMFNNIVLCNIKPCLDTKFDKMTKLWNFIFWSKNDYVWGTYWGKKIENRENMFFTRIERFWVEKKIFSKKFFWMIQNPKNRPYIIFHEPYICFGSFFQGW